MVLLFASIACGLFSFICAFILQFGYTGWRFLSGLYGLSGEKLANIDARRLRRRLSILLYVLSAGFLGGALLHYLKAIPEASLIPLYFLLILVVFNGVYFVYRRFDLNTYSRATRKSLGYLLLGVNLVFVLLILLFLV